MLLACFSLAGGLHGANFEETISVDNTRLTKVGEGTFRWMFFKVYDGALYLDAEKPEAPPLSPVAKRLILQYNVKISGNDFRESGSAILRRNVDEATWTALQDRLDRINAAYRNVAKGDRYSLTWLPGKGTTLRLNGDPLVTIEGEDFAKAYFSIWLGDDPAKKSFRDDLLGD